MKYSKIVVACAMLVSTSCIYTAEETVNIVNFQQLLMLIKKKHKSSSEVLTLKELEYLVDKKGEFYPSDQEPRLGEKLQEVNRVAVNLSKDHISKLVGKPTVLKELDESIFTWLNFISRNIGHINAIDLSDNNLTELPKGLLSVQSMILKNNKLTQIDLTQLGESVLYLDVTGNPINKKAVLDYLFEATNCDVIVALFERGLLLFDPELEKALRTFAKKLALNQETDSSKKEPKPEQTPAK